VCSLTNFIAEIFFRWVLVSEYLLLLGMKAQLVRQALENFGIVGSHGVIRFELHGVTINVESRDSVGNMIQNWFQDWLLINFPNALPNNLTQAFPDFFLDSGNKTNDLLEVKSFDIDRGPGFDIANFDTYCNSIIDHPYRLHSNYLIFGYQMVGSMITIKDVWLKKVWEITGSSGTYPLKVQEKKNVIYNIRPVIWYSSRSTFRPFPDLISFVNALNDTRYQYPQTRHLNAHWLRNLKNAYRAHYGSSI
jgi:hypothetical protein